jgi:hypothetical protein
VNLGAFLREARDDGFPAHSDRPPPLAPAGLVARRWKRGHVVAALTLGVLAAAAATTTASRRWSARQATAVAPAKGTPVATPARSTLPVERCTAGEHRTLARDVRLSAGLETGEIEGRIAAAVSTSPLEARAVEVDLATLSVKAMARLTRTRPVRRAVPLLLPDGLLDVEADEGSSFPTIDGSVTLREPRADAVRAARARDAYAVAFRRDGGIWALTSSAAGPLEGPVALSTGRVSVGAPSVATTSAGDVLVAWAERGAGADTWTVRWTRWTPGAEPEAPRTWSVPGMAPAVAALPGGGTILAWTEGRGGAHAVRASVLGDDGRPLGNPLALSTPNANAGQERIVLTPDGRGAVFFLEAQSDGRYALVARALSCSYAVTPSRRP